MTKTIQKRFLNLSRITPRIALRLASRLYGDTALRSGIQVSKKICFSVYRFSIVGRLRDREVACLSSDYQGSKF